VKEDPFHHEGKRPDVSKGTQLAPAMAERFVDAMHSWESSAGEKKGGPREEKGEDTVHMRLKCVLESGELYHRLKGVISQSPRTKTRRGELFPGRKRAVPRGKARPLRVGEISSTALQEEGSLSLMEKEYLASKKSEFLRTNQGSPYQARTQGWTNHQKS